NAPAGYNESTDTTGAVQELLARSKRQRITETSIEAMALVETRTAAIKPLVRSIASIVRFDFARVVVDGPGERIARQQKQPVGIGFLYLYETAVVISVRIVGRSENARIEFRERQPVLNWNGSRGIKRRLVLVVPLPKLVAVGARIAHFQQPLVGKLALNAEIVFQRVRRTIVGVH